MHVIYIEAMVEEAHSASIIYTWLMQVADARYTVSIHWDCDYINKLTEMIRIFDL